MASRREDSLVYIDPRSVKELQALGKALAAKADGKALKKALTKELKAATKPMVTEMQANARALAFASTSTRTGQRARRTAGVTKTGRTKRGIGLRDAMAKSIKTEVLYGATSAGIRVRSRSTAEGVNGIARQINRLGKVRHPVFGNREKWADTLTRNGKGWFTRAGDKHQDDVVAGVKKVLAKWTRSLTK